MYDSMPEANIWPNCQAQEFDGEKYHRCEIGPPPGHVFHRCQCGHPWNTIHGNGGKANG